jgi:hypothetical protein
MTTLGKLLLSLLQILGTDVHKNHSCCRKEYKYKTFLLTDSPGKILFKKLGTRVPRNFHGGLFLPSEP